VGANEPAATGVPLSRWSGPELAAEPASRHLTGPVSASSVLRILAEHPIKPWCYRSWIFPRDPDFAAKATVILDLYQGFCPGKPLAPGDRRPHDVPPTNLRAYPTKRPLTRARAGQRQA
jgi:hypothetical protein